MARVEFSKQVQEEWSDSTLWQRLQRGERKQNPVVVQQVITKQ
jgi:hypothetical protein